MEAEIESGNVGPRGSWAFRYLYIFMTSTLKQRERRRIRCKGVDKRLPAQIHHIAKPLLAHTLLPRHFAHSLAPLLTLQARPPWLIIGIA